MRTLASFGTPAPKGRKIMGAARGQAVRSFQRRRRWNLVKRGAVVAALVTLVSGAIIVWQLGFVEAWLQQALAGLVQTSRQAGLAVQHVTLTGRGRAGRDEVIAAVDVSRGAAITMVDLDAARGRLEALEWVRQATVRRQYPDTIAIDIDERHPFALWQHGGQIKLIDPGGVVITDRGLREFAGLTLVVGADAPEHAKPLIDLLGREPALHARVRAAIRVGGRRWRLRFDNGVDVELPARGAAGAWLRLAGLERERRILESDITMIDMRLADRLTVRLGGGAARRLRLKASDT